MNFTLKQSPICEQVKDYATKGLLEENLRDTEEHIVYLEEQIELIEQLGLQNYMQTAMGEIGS